MPRCVVASVMLPLDVSETSVAAARAAPSAGSVPLHGAHTPDDDEVSATLAAVECLRYGTTTVVEAGTVANPDRVAKAMETVGIRGTVGTWGWDIEVGPFTAPPVEVLERQAAVVTAHPRGGLVEGWVTLVGHDLASGLRVVIWIGRQTSRWIIAR